MQIRNNRRKRMLNKQEERTNDILNAITSKYNAHICLKNRIADVLEITNSGLSNKEYSYALKAHFDFVVTDKDYMPEFAVEFDGSQHKSNLSAIYNDELKNNICRKLGFPLLRITSEYFEKIGEFPTILSWITELYFLQKSFYVAQDRGEIPLDEPWMWFSVIGYDPVVHYRAFIRNAYDRGLCSDEVIRFLSGRSKGNEFYATLSTLKLRDDKYLANLVECLAINYFAIPAREISLEISDYNIFKKFKKYIEGYTINTYTYAEISEMQKEFIKQHYLCSFNIQLIESL